MVGLLIDAALGLLACFADAVVAVWRWAGMNGEFAARVEPPSPPTQDAP